MNKLNQKESKLLLKFKLIHKTSKTVIILDKAWIDIENESLSFMSSTENNGLSKCYDDKIENYDIFISYP
jgi:hypothetical protein